MSFLEAARRAARVAASFGLLESPLVLSLSLAAPGVMLYLLAVLGGFSMRGVVFPSAFTVGEDQLFTSLGYLEVAVTALAAALLTRGFGGGAGNLQAIGSTGSPVEVVVGEGAAGLALGAIAGVPVAGYIATMVFYGKYLVLIPLAVAVEVAATVMTISSLSMRFRGSESIIAMMLMLVRFLCTPLAKRWCGASGILYGVGTLLFYGSAGPLVASLLLYVGGPVLLAWRWGRL